MKAAAQLGGSQWVTRLSLYHVISGLSIVIGMFFWSDAFGIEHLQTHDWLSVIHLASLLRCNFWIVKCDSDVFMVWHLWQWKPAAQLSGSQRVTPPSVYHAVSGLSFVVGMFFGLPPLAGKISSTTEWFSVSYSSFMLRRNFWFFIFGRDSFMVWHLLQWIPAAQLSGSHRVTRLSCYDTNCFLSIVIKMFFLIWHLWQWIPAA